MHKVLGPALEKIGKWVARLVPDEPDKSIWNGPKNNGNGGNNSGDGNNDDDGGGNDGDGGAIVGPEGGVDTGAEILGDVEVVAEIIAAV